MIDTVARDTSSPAVSDLVGTYKRAPMKFVRGDGVDLYDENG